jgi:hypothetical protein
MKKILILVLITLFFSAYLEAQQSRDALYLKNGSILYGKILEMKDGQYRIKTPEGMLFTFSAGEVEKFILGEQSEKKAVRINDPDGLGFRMESGLLLGSSSEFFPILFAVNPGISFTFNRRHTFCFLTGGDIFEHYYLPLLLEYRYNVIKNNVAPFIYVKGGALISLSLDDEYSNYRGGWTYGIGTGFRWPIGTIESFIKMGYRFGYTVEESDGSIYDSGINYTYEYYFNRLEMTWGFTF